MPMYVSLVYLLPSKMAVMAANIQISANPSNWKGIWFYETYMLVS